MTSKHSMDRMRVMFLNYMNDIVKTRPLLTPALVPFLIHGLPAFLCAHFVDYNSAAHGGVDLASLWNFPSGERGNRTDASEGHSFARFYRAGGELADLPCWYSDCHRRGARGAKSSHGRIASPCQKFFPQVRAFESYRLRQLFFVYRVPVCHRTKSGWRQ